LVCTHPTPVFTGENRSEEGAAVSAVGPSFASEMTPTQEPGRRPDRTGTHAPDAADRHPRIRTDSHALVSRESPRAGPSRYCMCVGLVPGAETGVETSTFAEPHGRKMLAAMPPHIADEFPPVLVFRVCGFGIPPEEGYGRRVAGRNREGVAGRRQCG